MEAKAAELEIKIGNYEVKYLLFETTAPVAYDGGRTFTVHSYNGERLVAVHPQDVGWQVGRNSSGLHSMVPFVEDRDDSKFWGLHLGAITDRLFNRLTTPAEGE